MPKGKIDKEKDQKLLFQQFFGSLPQLESHYCRKDTEKMYLEPKWKTKAELYRLYLSYIKDEGKEHLKLSICTFHAVFEENNLSLFKPKKDLCDVCCSYTAGNLSQEKYNSHIKRKYEARAQKEADKEGFR